MKNFALVFLLSISLSAGAQDLSQKVTFEAAGVPAKRMLAELGAQTKVQLETAPQTAAEVLVVRAKDVPLSNLMAQIAKATTGVWRQEGTIYRLEADTAGRQAEARAELLARTKEMQKAIDKLIKPPPPGKDSPTAGGGFSVAVPFGGGATDPASKAILKLLPSIGASTLAAIARDGRIVFSTNPTRMQVPLGGNASAVIRQLVDEHNKMVEGRLRADENKPKTKEQEDAEQWMNMLGLTPNNKPVEGAPDKVLLIASRQAFFDGVSLQLRLYDTRGVMVLSGNQMIALDQGMFGDFAALVGGNRQPAAPTEPDKDIVFSERSKRIQDFFKTIVNPAAIASQPFPKEIKDLFLRPDKEDPLAFIHGEATLAVANEKDLNLVASLPDTMINAFGTFFSPAKLTVNAYLKELESGRNTIGKREDGWLVIKPLKPVEARRVRVDRMALATLLSAADKKGQPSLDDLAAYSLKAEPPMDSPAAMVYLGLFAPNATSQGIGGMVNWNMLRFYATLAPGQRSSMTSGAPIRFSTLSGQQRDLVQKMLFGSGTRLQIEARERQQGEEENGFISMIKSFMPANSTDYRDEPTEIMPTGLPSEGTVRLRVEGGAFAMIAGGQGSGTSSMYGALGADELAMMRYFKEDQQFSAFSGFMPAMDKLKIGQRETLTFKFYAAQNVAQTEVLRNDSMPSNAQTLSYDQLPDAFKKRIEDRIANMKKNPLPFGAMMGGFRPPPKP